eukprot:2814042-Rhodomonas_salina.4
MPRTDAAYGPTRLLRPCAVLTQRMWYCYQPEGARAALVFSPRIPSSGSIGTTRSRSPVSNGTWRSRSPVSNGTRRSRSEESGNASGNSGSQGSVLSGGSLSVEGVREQVLHRVLCEGLWRIVVYRAMPFLCRDRYCCRVV